MGEPPAVEITITNLNDNIDKQFLTDMVQKNGPSDELIIYYHPVTKRHLGLARIVFIDVKSARSCIDKYNGNSVMGKVCHCGSHSYTGLIFIKFIIYSSLDIECIS